MIQRIQTVFLSAIILTSSVLFFKPFEVVKDGVSTFFVTLMPGTLSAIVKPAIYGAMALNFIIMLLSLYTIFKFKSRRKQMKFCQVILALSAILTGNLFGLSFLKIENPGVIV